MLFYVRNSDGEWNEIWEIFFLLSHTSYIFFFISLIILSPSTPLRASEKSEFHVNDFKSTRESLSNSAVCARHYDASNLIVYFHQKMSRFFHIMRRREIYEQDERCWSWAVRVNWNEICENLLFSLILLSLPSPIQPRSCRLTRQLQRSLELRRERKKKKLCAFSFLLRRHNGKSQVAIYEQTENEEEKFQLCLI